MGGVWERIPPYLPMRVSDWDDSPRTPDIVGPSEPESRSTPIDPEIPQLLERRVPQHTSVEREVLGRLSR